MVTFKGYRFTFQSPFSGLVAAPFQPPFLFALVTPVLLNVAPDEQLPVNGLLLRSVLWMAFLLLPPVCDLDRSSTPGQKNYSSSPCLTTSLLAFLEMIGN